jgi:integrase
MKLTPKTIEHLKPRDRRVEIPDAGAAGLYLILQPSGHRSWATRYRANGKPVKLTIGPWPNVSLHDARVAAAEALKQVKLGNDPARARQDAKVRADAAKADTLTAICEKYLKREGGKLRTLDQRVSILRRLIYPVLGDKPIGSIKRSDIADLLDRIEDHNGPRMADVALSVVRKIMNWHATRDDEFSSPIVRGMGRQNVAAHRRTHILDDTELRKLWQATEDKTAFSALVRFLLLTGARRNEAAAMRPDDEVGTVRCTVKQTEVRNGREVEREVEVAFDNVWTLPVARSKTKVEVIRPLSKTAQEVLAALPRIDGCPYPFTSNGITPINSFSEPKRLLDARSRVVGWRLHDLRRTARSLLSRAGVNSDVAEKCLGHSRGDIVERYDRHEYLDEMQRAFKTLAAQIERIVNPPQGEIADLAAERGKRRR